MGIRVRNVDKSGGRAGGLGITLPVFIFNAAAVSTTGVKGATTPVAGTDQSLSSLTALDACRVLSITTANFSANTLIVKVWGTDFDGNGQYEESGVIKTSTTTNLTMPFRTVATIKYDFTGTVTTRTLAIGTLDKFGIYKIGATGDVLESKKGHIDGNTTTTELTADAGTTTILEGGRGVYAPAAAADGDLDYFLLVRSTYGDLKFS